MVTIKGRCEKEDHSIQHPIAVISLCFPFTGSVTNSFLLKNHVSSFPLSSLDHLLLPWTWSCYATLPNGYKIPNDIWYTCCCTTSMEWSYVVRCSGDSFNSIWVLRRRSFSCSKHEWSNMPIKSISFSNLFSSCRLLPKKHTWVSCNRSLCCDSYMVSCIGTDSSKYGWSITLWWWTWKSKVYDWLFTSILFLLSMLISRINIILSRPHKRFPPFFKMRVFSIILEHFMCIILFCLAILDTLSQK